MYMYCSCLLFGNKTMLIIIYSSCSCECIIENIFQITKYDVMLLLMLRAEKKNRCQVIYCYHARKGQKR